MEEKAGQQEDKICNINLLDRIQCLKCFHTTFRELILLPSSGEGFVVVKGAWGFTTLLTSQVISVIFYSEREKSDKFCSEVLISAWGSFSAVNLRHGTHGFTSLQKKVIIYSGFLRSEKIHRFRPGFNPRTSDPVASIITTGPQESTGFCR